MAALLNRDQCYSLGQPWTAFTQSEHALRKKRVLLGRRSGSHRVTWIQGRAGFSKRTAKIEEEEDEADPPSAGGTKKFLNLPGTVQLKGAAQAVPRDNKVVFVAGATGKVGSRTVRELLKLGFQVRASTRSVEKAEALFEDALEEAEIQPQETSPFALFSPAKLFGFLKPKPGKQLDIVECDLEDAESIEPALGNAGIVVCCIGASEKEILDVTGPYRIDFKATKNLVDAASTAQVNHFVLLTSLGTQKIGFPAAVLNLFWGVLVWKAKAEKALIDSGIPYTIVRPGGMERPTDSYKETHNLVLSEADTLFGGQVSNLQIAELIACIVENLDVSRNKIVEAVAETTAPLRPITELLEEIPSIDPAVPASAKGKSSPIISETKTEMTATKGRDTRILKEERRGRSQNDEEEQGKLKALREKYQAEIEAAKEKENAALAEKAELEKQAEEIRAKAEAAALAASQAKALEAAILAAAKKGNLLSEEEKQKIIDSVKIERQQKASSSEESKAVSKKTIALPFFELPTLGGVEISTPETETTEAASSDKEDDESPQAKEPATAAKVLEKKRTEETKKRGEEKRAQQEALKAMEASKKAEQEAAELKKREEARKMAEAKQKEEEEKEAAMKKKEEEEEAEKQQRAKLLAEEAAQKKKKEEEEAEKLSAAKEAEEKEKEGQTVVTTTAESVSVEKEANTGKAKAAPTFRWPWQKPEESEDAVPEETQLETTPVSVLQSSSSSSPPESKQSIPIAAKDPIPPPSSTPLSPYTMFPGLKPPLPPTPSSAASAATEVKAKLIVEAASPVQVTEQKGVTTEEAKSASTEDKESRKVTVEETAAREQEALAKAKAAASFVWPWQKPSPAVIEKEEEEEEALPTVNVSKEEIPARSESPPSLEPATPAQSIVGVEPKKTETLLRSSALSPYTGFPELKPPPPPTPSRSESASLPPPPPAPRLAGSEYAAEKTIISVDQTQVKEASPVAVIEESKETVADLGKQSLESKQDEESTAESAEDIKARKSLVEEVAAREREALAKARAATSFTWPWEKPDLGQAERAAAPPTEDNADNLQSCSTPLSPYTQFPGLKPPVPPRPSLPVQSSVAAETSKEETLPRSSTPLSPYTGFPDLKPPTTARSSAAAERSKQETLPGSSTPLSQFTGFPDLKPPTSVRSSAAVAAETGKEETLPRSSTPLSPYTGFPDLKPPTTPVPPKVSENGALSEVVQEPVGFKWPWQ